MDEQPSQPLLDNLSDRTPNNPDSAKFTVTLTLAQAQALAKLLPAFHAFQHDRDIKTKRATKKKSVVPRKEPPQSNTQILETSQRIKKTSSATRYADDGYGIPTYSRAASQGYYEQVDDIMKPCLRVLHLLKNHKTSWPFREPVDPIALGIPNYLEIVREPMDLQTIEKNLKGKSYATPSQFHADVNKIIQNSFEFNKHNHQFWKITSDFEQYYLKIIAEPSRSTATHAPSPAQDIPKKKKKPTPKPQESRFREPAESQPVTLIEKKQLAEQIKRIPQSCMFEVANIICDGKSPTSAEVNIESLSTQKIRQLQRYVREKLSMQVGSQERLEEVEGNDAPSEESSFQSESDS